MKAVAVNTKRGGARPNAGPKPADGVRGVTRYNVTLDDQSEAIARQLGEGDRSLGIRRALAMIAAMANDKP